MQVTGRLRERSFGAEGCRSLVGCEKEHAELSKAGKWLVDREVMTS